MVSHQHILWAQLSMKLSSFKDMTLIHHSPKRLSDASHRGPSCKPTTKHLPADMHTFWVEIQL